MERGSTLLTRRSKKGYGAYSKVDYVALREWCLSRKGLLIVCEQEGADWLPFRPLYDLRVSSQRVTTEVWWSEYRGSLSAEQLGDELAVERSSVIDIDSLRACLNRPSS